MASERTEFKPRIETQLSCKISFNFALTVLRCRCNGKDWSRDIFLNRDIPRKTWFFGPQYSGIGAWGQRSANLQRIMDGIYKKRHSVMHLPLGQGPSKRCLYGKSSFPGSSDKCHMPDLKHHQDRENYSSVPSLTTPSMDINVKKIQTVSSNAV